MKRLLAVAALVGVFLFSTAQFSGGPSGSVPVTDSAPGNPSNGQVWIRGTDLQQFVYSDSLSKWLGELQIWDYGHTNATYTGFLRCNPRILSDTTTDAEIGYQSSGVLRLMKVVGNATNAPNCTTYVFSDQTVVAKLVWGGTDQMVWSPAADSSGGWVAAAARVVVADGDVLSASYVPAAAPTNPSLSTFKMYFREEVTP